MPVIFSSSLLALPTALARYANAKPVEAVAAALNPSGPLYLPVQLLFAQMKAVSLWGPYHTRDASVHGNCLTEA